jgi:molybdopterin-containing oxidoreductase family membrane subunit
MSNSSQLLERKASSTPTAELIFLGLLALAGISVWIYQLSQGMQVTGLGQQVVWGLYIGAFFVAVGAGAGILALTGLSEFRPILPTAMRLQALTLALAAFVVGGLLIAMDVGNPMQLWRIVSAFRFKSMMTWDFWLLAVSGVVTVIYLLQARTAQPLKAVGAISVLVSLAVVMVEGWMLSVQAARPLWGSGLTVVSFLVGAAIAGLGLAAFAFPQAGDNLRSFLTGTITISLVLVIAEVLTDLLSGELRTAAETRLLLTGAPALWFWFQLIIGLIVPLVILIRGGSPALAGVLALLGVLAEKVWLLAVGQAEPWVALPTGSYFPSWVELVGVVGMIALGVLIYRFLPGILKAG